MSSIRRYLPNDQYDAALNANAPSAANPFATLADLAAASGIYGGSGNMVAGVTNVTMTATSVLQFDSANPGPGGLDGLLTIDGVNNRIGMGTATPSHGLQISVGDVFVNGGNLAIGATTPSSNYKLLIATDNSDGNDHRGQRIVLGGSSVTSAAQIAGIEIRSLNTKTATGTNNYRGVDINFTAGATVGTYNMIGMRVKLDTFTDLGSATINRYIGEFLDGNQGTGKVIADVTGSGLAQWVDPNTLISTSNIYNSDDTLTGNRTLNGGGNSLTLTNLSTFSVNETSGTLELRSATGLNLVNGTGNSSNMNLTQAGTGNIAMRAVSGRITQRSGQNRIDWQGSGAGILQHLFPVINGTKSATWRDLSGTVAYLSDIPAATGDGIYDGSGTVPTTTTVTVTDTINFSGGSIGINNVPTTAAFHVVGAGSTSGTFSGIFENSNNASILQMRNDGQIRMNQGQLATGDVWMRGQSQLYPFYMDASTGRVGIRTNTPGAILDVVGSFRTTNATAVITMNTGVFIQSGANSNTANFTVSNFADGTYFTVTSDSGTGRVGIGTASPSAAYILEAIGTARFSLGVLVATTTNNSVVNVGGDVETIGGANGFIVEDRTTTQRTRIYVDNGALFTENA